LIAQDILQVIYAPHKVFKRIIEKPSYIAAFIILLIFVVGQVATNTVYSQRAYFEDAVPNVSADTYNPWTSYTSYWQETQAYSKPKHSRLYRNNFNKLSAVP
jgi:hypothetical protein